MDIEFLKNFYDVATVKSISKVASFSHISQSALSQRISKLEQELGISLLERSNKGVNITREGELIIRHVETIIKSYNRMVGDISNFKENKNTFIISSPSSEMDSIILKVLLNIKEINDQWFFKVNTMSEKSVEMELDKNISDMALTYAKVETENITSSRLGSDELIFVAHPKVDIGESVTVKDLSKYNFVFLGDFPNLPEILNIALMSKGSKIGDLQLVFTANSIYIAKESIERTEDISLLPKFCVKESIEKGTMKTFQVEDLSFPYDIFFCYNKNSYNEFKKVIDIFSRESKKILK